MKFNQNRKKVRVIVINNKEYVPLTDICKNYKDRKSKVFFYAWVDRKDLNLFIDLLNQIKSKYNEETI